MAYKKVALTVTVNGDEQAASIIDAERLHIRDIDNELDERGRR